MNLKFKWKIYVFVFLFVLLFNFLSVSTVIFKSAGFDEFAEIVYAFFSPLCHQIDSRSFHINGVKLAVCSRCSLIYSGAFLGVILFPFVYKRNVVKKGNLLLIVAVFPSVVEFLIEKFMGIEILSFKILSSLWLGVIAGVILTSQIIDMFCSRRSERF